VALHQREIWFRPPDDVPHRDGPRGPRQAHAASASTGGGDQAMRERADELSLRIAQSLWYGYQLNESPDLLPDTLQRGAFEAGGQS